MDAELERIMGFLASVDDEAAERVAQSDLGSAPLDPRRPLVWDASYLRARVPVRAGAAELAAEADRLLGGEGLGHRSVVVPAEADARRLAPGFAGLGWRADRYVVMVARSEPRETPVRAEAVPPEDLAPAMFALAAEEPMPGTAADRARAVIEQLVARAADVARVVEERCFAVRDGGEVVSSCRLYSRGGLGQVEEVATRPRWRRRGFASAVVAAAHAASRARGDRLTFIVSTAEAGVPALYERLGFSQVGRFARFRRTAAS